MGDAIQAWWRERGLPVHMDDHFSIPDEDHLDEAEQRAMWDLLPAIKERYQRFQLLYHVHVLRHWEHCILVGFHLEEAIYGPRYYYPQLPSQNQREVEVSLPDDTVLVLLEADAEVIRERSKQQPHRYQLVQESDIQAVQRQFQDEFSGSLVGHKLLLPRFLTKVGPYLTVKDLLLLSAQPARG